MGLCHCQGVLAPECARQPIRDTGRAGKAATGQRDIPLPVVGHFI